MEVMATSSLSGADSARRAPSGDPQEGERPCDMPGKAQSLRRAIVGEFKALAAQSKLELQALVFPWRRPDGSIRRDCELAGLAAHVLEAIHTSKLGLGGGVRRSLLRGAAFDPFPAERYSFVRMLDAPESVGDGAWRNVVAPPAVVASDFATGTHVLLTCFPKAAVTEWQMQHAWQVMRSLSRRPRSRFQRVLRVWDARKNWVLTQEFHALWTPARALFADLRAFSENLLRDVVFQVASLVHYLHAHSLSLAGELRHWDVMILDGRVTLMLSASLAITGCILVPATDQNKAADVAAIGMLMFQLTMAPYSPTDKLSVDAVESVIEEQLNYLSPSCRDVMFECLMAKLSIDELLKRKWLRNVGFLSIAAKRDGALVSSTHTRKLLYNSLLWKLATFFVEERWRTGRPAKIEDEDDTDARQRGRRPTKRFYGSSSNTGRGRSFAPAGSGIRLRRGAAVLPPFSTALAPAQFHNEAAHTDEQAAPEATALEQQRNGYLQSWMSKEVALDAVHVDSVSAVAHVYDGFDYAVPAMTSELYEGVAYDDFFESSYSDTTAASSADRDSAFMVLPNRQDAHTGAGSGSAAELEREILRSLQVDASTALASHRPGSDDRHDAASAMESVHEPHSRRSRRGSARSPGAEWRELTLDAVFFSVFGPKDVSRREAFRLDVWAYLKQQRASMLETALERSESECASRLQPLQIARGTLVTVTMDASARFSVVGDDCKSFRWTGEVDGVSFNLVRTDTDADGCHDGAEQQDDLCTARVVVGAKVSMLFIRLRAAPESNYNGVVQPSAVALLETEMQHVAADVREIPRDELELLEPVGSGAFGSAMLARWTAPGEASGSRHVVVKTLRQDAYLGSDALDELRHEATVMHMLGKHPHVVELLGISTTTSGAAGGAGAASTTPSIVTEYLPNGSVEDVLGIRKGARPRALSSASSSRAASSSISSASSSPPALNLFARTIMARDAAHGLANIHQARFLHRDIAARNCLVDAAFRVKVGDFGLSRRLAHGLWFDDERRGFGPVKWMAPESVLPPHVFSTHSDAYMFGVLLYEILSGQPPFPDVSAREAMALILEGKHVPIPASLPATHHDLMAKCFDVHPRARPSMDEIYFTLDKWVLEDTRQDGRHAGGHAW